LAESRVEPDDFVMLLARHEPRVRAFVSTLVGFDADAIDEVLQSTFLVAWKKLATFRYADESPGEELVRWVCTIARFEVLGYLRDQRRRKAFVFDELVVNQLADLQESESEWFEARRSALRTCLQRLAGPQLEAIRLRYALGLSMSEVAARQNRSVKAATVAMCRLRKLLEECIRRTISNQGLV
jgi:RNA polymerase sigma-70 factor (ECF subfamily)